MRLLHFGIFFFAFARIAAAEEPIAIPTEELAKLLPQFTAFHAYYKETVPRILAQEERYLTQIEAGEEGDPQEIESARDHFAAIRHEAQAKMDALEKQRDVIELACYEQKAAKANEKTCAALHDELQIYEREIATFAGMFEVMDGRYEEAQDALHGGGEEEEE